MALLELQKTKNFHFVDYSRILKNNKSIIFEMDLDYSNVL